MDHKRKFNWITPLLFYLLFITLFYLFWPSNTYDSTYVPVELCGSAFIALPLAGIPLIISTIYYKYGDPSRSQNAWWHSKYIYLLLVPVLIGFVFRVINTNPETQLYKQGIREIKNHYYGAAISDFEALLERYPNSRYSKEVKMRIADLKIESIKESINQGSYFVALAQIKENQLQETSQGKEWVQTIFSKLYQDTGDDGQTYLKALKDNACLKAASKDPADPILIQSVKFSDIPWSLQPPEKGKAMLCGDPCPSGAACYNGSVQLPAELTAASPSELGYVITAFHSDTTIETCEYEVQGPTFEFGTTVQKVGDIQRYQKTSTLRIYRISDGKEVASQMFSGSVPGACPEEATFSFDQAGHAVGGENSQDIYGEDPSSKDILEWIKDQIGA